MNNTQGAAAALPGGGEGRPPEADLDGRLASVRAEPSRRSLRVAPRPSRPARDAIDQLLEAERRRLAADVHDLIMQDISFALARTRAICDDPAAPAALAEEAVLAGERALDGARQVLEALQREDSRMPRQAVEHAARTAARGVEISFAASSTAAAEADALTTHVLVHVAREAVTNAIKHAEPSRVAVVVARDRGWLLVVSDDGCGLDADAPGDGFGIASMRRHAEFLGGRLSILSAPGTGSVVELVLP